MGSEMCIRDRSITQGDQSLPLYSLGYQPGSDDGEGDAFVAAAASDGGGYWLAYRSSFYTWRAVDRSVESNSDEPTSDDLQPEDLSLELSSNWSLRWVNGDGQIDWSASLWGVDISLFEERFGQDLNGDGEISPRPATQVLDDGSQGDGVGLQQSGEGILSITQGDQSLPLYSLGYQLGRDDDRYAAAAAAEAGGYWLARSTPVWSLDDNGERSLTTERSWSVLLVDAKGNQDWSSSYGVADISSWEEVFGRDLDGDQQLNPTGAIPERDQPLWTYPNWIYARADGLGEADVALASGFTMLKRGRAADLASEADCPELYRSDADGFDAEGFDADGIYGGSYDDSSDDFSGTPAPVPTLVLSPPNGHRSRLLLALDRVAPLEAPATKLGFAGLPMVGKRGDDRMSGSQDNDRIIGARNRASRFGQDRIRTGAGYDQIVLGGTQNGFYQARGDRDYAHLISFDMKRDQLVLNGSLSSYSVRREISLNGNTGAGLYGHDGDLIALIQTRGGEPFSLKTAWIETL